MKAVVFEGYQCYWCSIPDNLVFASIPRYSMSEAALHVLLHKYLCHLVQATAAGDTFNAAVA